MTKRISVEDFMRYRSRVTPISMTELPSTKCGDLVTTHRVEKFLGNNGKYYNMHIIHTRGNKGVWINEKHNYLLELIKN